MTSTSCIDEALGKSGEPVTWPGALADWPGVLPVWPGAVLDLPGEVAWENASCAEAINTQIRSRLICSLQGRFGPAASALERQASYHSENADKYRIVYGSGTALELKVP